MFDKKKFNFFKKITFFKKLSFFNNILLIGLSLSLLIGVIFNAPKILFVLIAIGFLIVILNIFIIFLIKRSNTQPKNDFEKTKNLKDLIDPDNIPEKDMYEIKDV